MAQWEAKPGWARAWHVCGKLSMFACWSAREEQIACRESSENVLYLGCTDFFFIISFYLKKIYVKHISLPISHGFAVVLH